MLHTSVTGSIVLHIVILAAVNSAPTHHLTIGVQGNTPTLIVTSSELGITADIEGSHAKTAKIRKDFKSNEKIKLLKAKNSVTYKKGKSFYFSKNSETTTVPPSLMDLLGSTSASTAINNAILDTSTISEDLKTHSTKTEASPRATSTTDTVPNLHFTSTTEQIMETIIPDDNDRNKMGPTTENEVLLSTLPANAASSASNSPTEGTVEATATTTSTVAPLRSTSTETESVEISTTETTETTTAESMHADNNDDKYNQTEYGQDVTLDISTQTPTVKSAPTLPTSQSQQSTSSAPEQTFTTSEGITTDGGTTVQSELSTEMETMSTQLPWSSQELSRTESVAVSDELTSTETILKLIDLEKHDAKPLNSLSQDGREHDNGHDGLKNIKKKQLVDKHYVDALRPTEQGEIPKEGISKNVDVKHGFLGPIKMEEQTFHVSQANSASDPRTSDKAQYTIESQLQKGNFVEIKSNQDQEITSTTPAMPSEESVDIQFTLSDTREHLNEVNHGPSTALSTTVFRVADTLSTKIPSKAANTMFTSTDDEDPQVKDERDEKKESKISDIQIEVYDSTIDSIVASTNFKDTDITPGKSTKPPLPVAQQERFTQYVIDRTETSTQESINFSTIQVASGKPEPAAIEIHINVSESFNNESEDVDVSFPQSEYNSNGRGDDASYDDVKINDEIKLKVSSNAGNLANKERSDEVLVVEIVDNVDNSTESRGKSRNSDDLFTTDVKEAFVTPPPPPPPPPYQPTFDRDSDTIFYISNTEVKVGETLPAAKKAFIEERKIKLENQFFPVNYMASTHPNVNNAKSADDASDHHLYEEDIILSSNRNQADSLKIYRNRNEPSPPLDVTYVGESIIEVEQSPDSSMPTSFSADRMITPQPDVIIQPAILPEISIGVPVIGELPPQIELKEIDFMPSEAQLHHSGVYSNDDNSNININSNAINSGSNYVDNRLDESSVQYGGDLIDESADGGFDGVEGSYPFGNPATMTKRKQNHLADYAHLYINYGVNNMRKDELTADVKDSGEVAVILERNAGGGNANEPNATFKDFLNKVVFDNTSNGMNESERISNVTAFSIMEDVNDMDDKNTEDIINLISLAIGLFIVILPVVVTCSMLWALRYLYKKYHSNSTDSNGNLDPADAKSQPNEDAAEKGESVQESAPTLPNDKDDIQKCPDSFANPSADTSIVKFATEPASQLGSSLGSHCKMHSCSSKARELPLSLALHPMPGETQSVHDEIAQGPNGSITKMTLENNLLIVETEERSDMSRVARETKMDYNKDGVFVVEVARGIDSKTIPDSPVTEGVDKMLSMFEPKHNGTMGYKLASEKISHNNEKVQIHSPPPEKTEEGPRSLHQIEEVDEPVHSPRLPDSAYDKTVGRNYKSNTGLSQSDLSLTSSNDSNKDYCYGNQELYVVEQSGYCTSSPTGNVALKCDSKDIKDDDRNSENGRHLEHSPGRKEDTREAEDVLDTINRQKESETLDEKNVAQDHKENENEIETLVTNQADSTSVEVEVDVVTLPEVAPLCTGHAENTSIETLLPSENTGDEISLDNSTENIINNATSPVHLNGTQESTPNDENDFETYETTPVNGILQEDTEKTISATDITDQITNKHTHLTNGSDSLPDLVPADVSMPYTNGGETNAETPNNCTMEFENGYDSIISLPDPPPTSDELLCSDLSDHQMDSLPPPPPPLATEFTGETFTLKDLPPPLANSGSESMPIGDTTNYYASLPPPPPTTLHVSSTTTINGNMHASPLTPPASPPPHFTNGLHSALCPPIAVDVNGS